MNQRVILDTDILVDFFHDQRYARDFVLGLLKKESIYVSILSIAELRTGFTAKQAEILLPKLYKMVVLINLSLKIVELAGSFRYEYRYKGKSLSTIDTLIAATAIVGDYQLATRNKKDFPMPQLKLYPL